jgi:hypothetical protein
MITPSQVHQVIPTQYFVRIVPLDHPHRNVIDYHEKEFRRLILHSLTGKFWCVSKNGAALAPADFGLSLNCDIHELTLVEAVQFAQVAAAHILYELETINKFVTGDYHYVDHDFAIRNHTDNRGDGVGQSDGHKVQVSSTTDYI